MWKLSFKDNKNKWQSFTDKGNTDANAELNKNPREHIFYIEHHWQNGWSPKWKTTWYEIDVREKTQQNQEPDGKFNKRAIKIEWSEDPWAVFDFDTWVLGPAQPSNAATTATTATTAPAATTATTGGGGGGGGANTSMVTEASTAPTMSDTSAGPSTHDALPDPWAKANNSQRKYWQNSDANWQGSQDSGWQTIDDKASNMAGVYGRWHGGQYGGPAKKDGVRVAASTDEQPATVAPNQGGAAATQESQAATPPPGLEGQASTHKSHENSPATWPTWEKVQATKQAMEQDAIATETPPKEHDAPFTQEAMPESQAITHEIIMKAPPPHVPSTVKERAQHPKRAPPVCPIPKSLPQGLEQMGSDDSNSSIGGNQQGSDGSTKAVPLLAYANEEKLANLSEQVARLTAELDATKRAALSGEPIPLPQGNW
jgi:hypothetical protein